MHRVVVDGDVVPAVPPFNKYVHMGTEVLIDGLGDTGTIIINPSSVEKVLIQKTKASVMGHLLGAYTNGLKTVKFASGMLEGSSSIGATSAGNNNDIADNAINTNGENNNDKDSSCTNKIENSRPALDKVRSIRNSTIHVARVARDLQRQSTPHSYFGSFPSMIENDESNDEIDEKEFFDCKEN